LDRNIWKGAIGVRENDIRDVVVVGGGIAGSALALVLARNGVKVTVLERQHEYRDRVRGELMHVWGVADAQRLGIVDAMLDAGGTFATRMVLFDETIPPQVAEQTARDLVDPISGVPGPLCAGHPAMCHALSRAAEVAGAQFVYGVGPVNVTAGERPTVTFTRAGHEHQLPARLVVGADGRNSSVRNQAGIMLHRAGSANLISGLLIEDVSAWPQDWFSYGTEDDRVFLVAPQGSSRLRLYTATAPDQRARYAGAGGTARFLDDFRRLRCMPLGSAIASGVPIGPCATFEGGDTWTDVPIIPGVVLIGDAAGYNNPIIGQGLSLAMRDVRVLSSILLSEQEWSPARLQPYADERGERLRRARFAAAFFATIFATFGPEGAARRATFFDRLRNPHDPSHMILLAIRAGFEQAPAWIFTEGFRTDLRL
jgi:2-polyprenyl-6-methoxyphenol hydroxylase-like FAD-dependent oxidoreductase